MKRTLSIILAAILMLGVLTACGGQTESPAPSTAPESSAPETGTPESEQPETPWPEKTVNIIVPYSAGGDTDMNARALAEKLAEKTGGTFVVTNIGGNGGATGALEALSSDPDGYTMLFHHTGFIVNQLTGATTYTYDDVEFVGIVGRSAGNIITMNAKYGITNIDELIAYTKEHPGELKIAANTGATTHATALSLRAAGADIKMVDAGSSTERIAALLGGHVDIIVNPINTIADYLKTGELVGLCTDNDTVSATLRDQYNLLPASEQGYDSLGLPFYYTMMFPKGTDRAIVDKLDTLLDDIINNDTEYQETIYTAYLQEPCFYDSEEGLKIMKEAFDNFSDLDFNA
ncbi:MAG: tripartite tricarboxylate transporter substrate binding protein [Candidatus Heteroscillospira sp.]|jgi:tripartite-type tricarboxylate transporter receptor subunit TctC